MADDSGLFRGSLDQQAFPGERRGSFSWCPSFNKVLQKTRQLLSGRFRLAIKNSVMERNCLDQEAFQVKEGAIFVLP